MRIKVFCATFVPTIPFSEIRRLHAAIFCFKLGRKLISRHKTKLISDAQLYFTGGINYYRFSVSIQERTIGSDIEKLLNLNFASIKMAISKYHNAYRSFESKLIKGYSDLQ
jgi:hypothetical protein